jgi:DamX protein
VSSYDPLPQNRLEPDYLAGYGLRVPPFADNYDQRFLYLDRQRRQLFVIMEHLSQHKHLILLVVAERGMGKSSIKQRYMEEADESCLICDVDAHPMMDVDELLTLIAQGFGMIDIPVSASELHESLYSYLAAVRQQGRMPVLMVDDAHELPQDALEALFYLADAEAGEGNLLHSVLFCEPAIEIMLESSAIQSLQERITHHLRISPFDEEQTAEYIRYRLAVAGLEGASPFSPGDIRRIYEASGGVPAQINRAAHQLLGNGRIDKLEDNDDQSSDSAMADEEYLTRHKLALFGLGLAVLLLIVGLWWWFGAERTSPATALPVTSNQTVVELPLESKSDDEMTAITQEEEDDKTSTEAPDSGTAEDALQSGNETPIKTPIPVVRIDALTPNPVPGSDEPQTLVLRGEGFDESTRITVEWGNQRKTLEESRVRLVDQSQLAIELTVGNEPQTWLLIARNPQTGAQDKLEFRVKAPFEPGEKSTSSPDKNKVTSPAPSGKTGNDLAWLQSQPADHYTLQLLAGYQAENLRMFLKQHSLQTDAVIYESRHNDKPWFGVVYGSYPDRDTAQVASKSLPKGVEPWIRRMGDVQRSLVVAAAPKMGDKPMPSSGTLHDHTAWLWDQDPGHYTLQLIAGPNEKAAQEFIRHQQLGGKALYYRTLRNGQPWFVVIMGNYADRQAALDGREQLPSAFKDNAPWPRSFSDIHADLARQ